MQASAKMFLRLHRVPLQIAVALFFYLLIGPQGASAAPAHNKANSAAPVSTDKKIDVVFKDLDSPNTPGASVAVIQHGKIIFAKGYGIANLEYNLPIKPDTIFHVASVSKQFTAMAVVLLELDGKLSIDDDIHKYLPELPDYGARITLRNLLQHTSGIRDQWQILALAGWNLQDVITQDQILRMLFRQKELNFRPGTRNLYSNAGYTLLAEIVTRVSGMPFPQFCAERIFTPLHMTHTHFHQDLTRLVPGRAYSYDNKGKDFAASPLNYANVGATSLFTTASDLVLWLDNFRAPKVGGAAGVARMQEEAVLSDGKKTHYGLGIALDPYRGLKAISHDGGDAGYRSKVLWFPEQELGVAVVSNLGSVNPDKLAKSVAEIYIGDKMTPQESKAAPEPKYVTVGPRELEKFVGVYPLPKIDQTLDVVLKDEKLWLDAGAQLELHPVGPGHFYCKEIQADMQFSPQEHSGMHVKVTQPGGAVNEGDRNPVAPETADYLPYTGAYWSEELETQYTFFVREGKLYARHAHHGEIVLAPAKKDQFTTGWWFAPQVTFTRDSKGNVDGVTLGGGRVVAVTFTRKPGPPITEAAPTKH